MVKVISIGNYKGGVGKSTLTEVLSYIFSTKYNYKTLVVDLDPQADVTFKLKNTFNEIEKEADTDILTAMIEKRIEDARISLHENLDIITGHNDMEDFDKFIFKTRPEEDEYIFFQKVFNEIIREYDFVFLDTRPSTAVSTKNAICISDYVIITTDTKESGYRSSKKVYEFIGGLLPYNPKVRLIGVVPYLVNVRGSTSQKVKSELDNVFQEDMYQSFIKDSDRLVTWGKYGISEKDHHDKNAMAMYEAIAKETLDRMKSQEAE